MSSAQLRVGIITMPHKRRVEEGTSHIMKTYVDWFETRGVRVVAIPYDTPRPEWYFNRVDGIVIPGGGAKTDLLLYQTAMVFIRHSLELWHNKRKLFPIWGTCLGFEIIVTLLGHIFPLQEFNALRYMKNLETTKETAGSSLFSGPGFSPEFMKTLTTAPIMEFNHSHGISPQKFRANVVLHRVFAVTAVARDRDGKAFVAAIEGRNRLPIYGVQGHPERQPVTNAPFLDFFVRTLAQARHGRGGTEIADIYGTRPRAVIGKCSQYPEHRAAVCFFFKDGADGGKLPEARVSDFIKKLIGAGAPKVISD